MNYPRGLLPLALLAWGWAVHASEVALPLAVLCGSSPLLPWRWEPGQRQYQRLGDLTSILTVALLGFLYLGQSTPELPIYIVLKWLPLLLLPLLAAQLCSNQQSLPLSALFYSMRGQSTPPQAVDFRLPYVGVCVLAAGAGNQQSPAYLAMAASVLAYLLWHNRPRSAPAPLWPVLLACAALAGHYTAQGLQDLQGILEERAGEWLTGWSPDPFNSWMRIGDVGQLKASNKIEFIVSAEAPLLLMQGNYDRYLGKSWSVSQRQFGAPTLTSDPVPGMKRLEIRQSFKPQALLALPPGSRALTGLETAKLQQTPFGSVKLTDAPSYADYHIYYDGQQHLPASPYDLELPDNEMDWLRQVGAQLQLPRQTPGESRQAIAALFQEGFSYSLYQAGSADAGQVMRDFMLRNRAGHCEYYAVATVLLLRYAGIPARFAAGYSVQEYDPASGFYLVRRRHAHAWAIAQINGIWQAVDTTPAQWLDIEQQQQTDAWQVLSDWFVARYLTWQQWRWQQRQDAGPDPLWVVAIAALLGYVGWKLYGLRGNVSRKQRLLARQPLAFPGQDSELYGVLRALEGSARAPQPGESYRQWAERLDDAQLRQLVSLHQRYRFDTNGLSGTERQQLRQLAQQWQARFCRG